MPAYYAVAYLLSQPYVDDPEIYLLYKFFDFLVYFYTAYQHPDLTFIRVGAGALILATHALLETIEEQPPLIGCPHRGPALPNPDLRTTQQLFAECTRRHPTAYNRLTQVLRNLTILGAQCSTSRPNLPRNYGFF